MAEVAAVEVVRSGGFAGIRRTTRTDGGTLSSEQRAAIEALLDGPVPPPAPGADRFRYGVTITFKDGSTRRIELAETAVPPVLRDVIR